MTFNAYIARIHLAPIWVRDVTTRYATPLITSACTLLFGRIVGRVPLLAVFRSYFYEKRE